jgi:phosphoribosylaminoimidazole (AIR) synthetase
MVLIVRPAAADQVIASLQAAGVHAWVLGDVVPGVGGVHLS